MKTVLLKISICMALYLGITCSSIEGKEPNMKVYSLEKEKIEVYYFHYTRRCVTCLAVENVTKEALEELYSEELESSKIIFKAVNLDEDDSEKIAELLEISGQSLLIVSGEVKENITTDAFMNAKSNPDKLKQLIKNKINPLLEK